MNTFARIELFLAREEGTACFYTVRLSHDGEDWYELTETDDFINAFQDEDEPHFFELLQLLEIIRLRGAKQRYFRHEGPAHALPQGNIQLQEKIIVNRGNHIRLYCIRLSERIVLLMNGDLKTARDPLECPNVKRHFQLARQLARQFDEAHRHGDLIITEDEILPAEGTTQIILEF